MIEGVEVPITSRAKTVADCFKYRNKLGIDVAVEALKGYLGKRDAPWTSCSRPPRSAALRV